MSYPSNHYASHTGHSAPYYHEPGANNANSSSAAAYRYPPGSSSSDWGREREFDYRRDIERRAPPPPSGAL